MSKVLLYQTAYQLCADATGKTVVRIGIGLADLNKTSGRQFSGVVPCLLKDFLERYV